MNSASNDEKELDLITVKVEKVEMVEGLMEGLLDTAQLENFRNVERRAKACINFYWHTVTYVLGIGFLIMIYLFSCLIVGKLYHPWFIWPALVWGGIVTYQFVQLYICGENSVK